MADDLAARREEYSSLGFDRPELAADPFDQFRTWYQDWLALDPFDANAMAVATASASGRPSVRFVLLKALDHGFCFYTSSDSQKGRELSANPQASICFAWVSVQRQVRVSGTVERVSAEQADVYFASRPRNSRLGAWASDQSRPIDSRQELEDRWSAAAERFAGSDVPRPDNWGGYRVVPDEFEFWQGRESRLHDRFRYRQGPSEHGWLIERLMP